MNDPFQAAVIEAVEGDRVPPFDFAMIQQRAARQSAEVRPAPRKRSLLLAAAIVGFPCLAAAAAILPSPALRQAVVARLEGLHVVADSTKFVASASVDPGTAAKNAAFRLVVPQGLPAGARLSTFEEDGSEGTSYTASYALPNGRTAEFLLQKAVPHTTYAPWIVVMQSDGDHVTKAEKLPAHVWITGDEVVTAVSASMSAKEFATVERAMGAHDAPLPKASVR